MIIFRQETLMSFKTSILSAGKSYHNRFYNQLDCKKSLLMYNSLQKTGEN